MARLLAEAAARSGWCWAAGLALALAAAPRERISCPRRCRDVLDAPSARAAVVRPQATRRRGHRAVRMTRSATPRGRSAGSTSAISASAGRSSSGHPSRRSRNPDEWRRSRSAPARRAARARRTRDGGDHDRDAGLGEKCDIATDRPASSASRKCSASDRAPGRRPPE
jgi:hypothetical protein